MTVDVALGEFHRVTGVAVGSRSISILDRNGTERMIPIMPHFNRTKAKHDPIYVIGEFGDFSQVNGGGVLEGIEPRDITRIEIELDPEDFGDFHARTLRLESSAGPTLIWDLYCEGKAT